MKTAIENLNDTIHQREKMISEIISKKHNPKTDRQFDLLESKYRSKSFAQLQKILSIL